MRALLRVAGGCACLALAGWFLLPLGSGILHVGMVWPALVLVLGASLCFFPGWYRRLPARLWKTCAVCLAAGLALAAAVLGLMLSAASRTPDEADPPATVVVLGCQVRPDGRPSLMLRRRIEAAYGYLAAHPEAVCVASGGTDDREPFAEARCIAEALIAMGVDPARIYQESDSRSTAENLAFSAALIAENGLDPRVVVATDTFHQYRGAYYARRAGLTPSAVCAAPYLPLAPSYWAREMAGILAAWLRGY